MTSPNHSSLSSHFDCVVMLTWSDWYTEMRSNRYHYATRFAKHLPVIFVQPDLIEHDFHFEKTEVENLSVLHISRIYGLKQSGSLNQALLFRGFIRPLLWIYNSYFLDFILSRYSSMKIYHATEDYFNPTFLFNPGAEDLRNKLRRVLNHVDLVVSVSDGVKASYVQNGGVGEKIIVLPNGCDYNFWAPLPDQICKLVSCDRGKKIAFYQGGISFKLDFELIHKIMDGLPDWEFWFCGEVFTSHKEWNSLRKHKNLKYFGKLHPVQVRELAYKSTVAIIPFIQNDWIIEKSHPLKAFEYVTCGLPVVTVPIKSLEPFPQVFRFADSPGDFINGIRAVCPSRWDLTALNERLEVAKKQDYDQRFETLTAKINFLVASRGPNQIPAKILVLHNDKSNRFDALMEHIEKLALLSRHRIFCLSIANGSKCEIDLAIFDGIIVTQSVRSNAGWDLSSSYNQAIREFGGFKILFVRDESKEEQERVRSEIEYLGYHQVFTFLAEKDFEAIYPPARFPQVEFSRIFPIYLAPGLESYGAKRISERKILLGVLRKSSGNPSESLAEEVDGKLLEKIRISLQNNGRIEPVGGHRREGARKEEWLSLLEECRAILLTPTSLLKDEEESVWRDIFEAIAHKTALVFLGEIGSDFGLLKPDMHYIQLKEDLSNIDQVQAKLCDPHFLEELAGRAFSDVIKSGAYSYEKFIRNLDLLISNRVSKRNGIVFFTNLSGEFRKMKGELPSFIICSLITDSLGQVGFNPKAGSFNLRAVGGKNFLNRFLKTIFIFIIKPVMCCRFGRWTLKLIPERLKSGLRKYYYRWDQN